MVMGAILVILLFLGLLFSFAPVLLGIFVALLVMAIAAGWFLWRKAAANAPSPGPPRDTPPARSELPKRPPSNEAMRAQGTPGGTRTDRPD